MRKTVSILLALIVCLSALSALPVFAVTASGTWGDLSWSLDNNGTLTISGEGPMDGFAMYAEDAWRYYDSSITNVIIENGVTTIGSCAFQHCWRIKSVSIPDSVTTIGIYAFFGCISLESITVPNSVTTIIGWAFVDCGLENVYYGGSEEQWNNISIGEENNDLLAANIIYNYTPAKPGTAKGDLNGDDTVDNTDAGVALKYDAGLIELTAEQLAIADVNNDSLVDNGDASMILRYDAGIIDSIG